MTSARRRAIARIALGSAVMVAISMTFQIPLPAYVAYLVFVASQDDAASTLVTSLGGVIAATIAVAISLLFYVFDAGEPALRIPLLALSAFAGSFFTRTSVLGPIAFLSGYILVLTQTLVDDIPLTDPLTHELLWLWVVVAAPVAVTATTNLMFGESPVALSQRRAADLFQRMARYVEGPSTERPERLRVELLALGQLKNKAFRWDKRLKAFAQEDEALIAIMLEILALASRLPEDDIDMRRDAATAIRAAGAVFTQRRKPGDMAPIALPAATTPSTQATARALQLAIDDLLDRAQGKSLPALPPAPARLATHHFLVPDAFQNRGHARFAIKMMLAVLASYATYTLLDWPGIRTAVTTCFFVSLTTFGESMHKFTLRASGAIIGGLLAGICIVFVLPLLTDIGQLCLLVAAVAAFSAWISTGSETIAYAGMQIAFAFFLGVLQGYGPTTDLTGLRDRVVGILIGNVWVTVVFASLWPVSAADQARTLRAAALNKISAWLRAVKAPSAQDMLNVQQDLSHADVLQSRANFEWRKVNEKAMRGPIPSDAERIAADAFTLLRVRGAATSTASTIDPDAQIASQIDALLDPARTTTVTSDNPSGTSPLVQQARAQLKKDIGHAMRAA